MSNSRSSSSTSKNRPRTSFECAICRKPIRKGASIDTRSWTRCEGYQRSENGDLGMMTGVSIVLATHSKCSKDLKDDKALVRRLDEYLRNRSKIDVAA